MLTAFAILGVLAALFLAAALATLDREGLAPAERDAADVPLPAGPMAADDVRGLRFGLAARGYRMSEVDAALDRLAADLEARDRRIAELEQGAAAPVTAAPEVAPATDEAFGDVAPAAPVADEDLPTGPSAGPLQPPDVVVGQAPVEPVDPPAGLAAHLDMPSVEQADAEDQLR